MSITDRPYDESYPPSLWGVVPASGATAGIPGAWTPAGSTPPASVAALMAGTPNTVTASPATPWTSGQFVQTRTTGAPGRATWTGTAWVGGAAPLDAEPGTGAASAAAPESSPPEPSRPPAPDSGGGGVDYSDEPPAEPQRRRRSRS